TLGDQLRGGRVSSAGGCPEGSHRRRKHASGISERRSLMGMNLAHHFEVVESSDALSSSSANAGTIGSHTEQPEVCTFCYGSGMEVVPGKGARRCRCRNED